jgi:hypothetical protein
MNFSQIVREARHNILRTVFAQQGFLEHTHPSRHVECRTVLVVFHSRHFGYFLFRTNSSHWGIEARAIWMKKPA